jgi:hypothetical protein
MIGSSPRSPQWFPLALVLAACNGGGGGSSPPNVRPTIVSASFVGSGPSPTAGDTLLLFCSEDVALGAGALLTDLDVVLSGSATLGAVTTAPTLTGARRIEITLGDGVTFVPGTTTIAFAPTNDAVRDTAGALATGGTGMPIGTSDGASPTLTNVTVAAIDDALNGTGDAGGTLQVASNGWPLDLTFTDNGTVDPSRTQVVASVAVTTVAGSLPAGSDLGPFLSVAASTATTARLSVPSTVAFGGGTVLLSVVVVDTSGRASAPVTFDLRIASFSNARRPFETVANSSQVWFLDFARDVETITSAAITGGATVDATPTANGSSDFAEVLLALGLLSATPVAVGGGQDSNQVVLDRFKAALVAELGTLFDGANVTFTLTRPSGSFGSSARISYNSFGYSQISIAGSPTVPGQLGVAIFDASNSTQDDDTDADFGGVRLGVFLQTIADVGLLPPSTSGFRQTFNSLAPALSTGVPVGEQTFDALRLAGSLSDSRRDVIDTAIADFARFTAVVVAHECGHSMGLVQNGPMPTGLYGNDPVNFPDSTDGHIRNTALFPSGTNVMSPALSYNGAIHPATAFNSLNLAYLREQVFYGN